MFFPPFKLTAPLNSVRRARPLHRGKEPGPWASASRQESEARCWLGAYNNNLLRRETGQALRGSVANRELNGPHRQRRLRESFWHQNDKSSEKLKSGTPNTANTDHQNIQGNRGTLTIRTHLIRARIPRWPLASCR